MVFLIEGSAKYPVLDILSGAAHFCLNPNSKDLQKILKNRVIKRNIIRKKECCFPKSGQRVIGEVDETGDIIVHSFDCAEAKKYWWG
jgi:(p)ppGpp synthase/HD superfamily hydrolase